MKNTILLITAVLVTVLVFLFISAGCIQPDTRSGAEVSGLDNAGVIPGMNATVGFTFFDETGRPVVTTDKLVFSSAYQAGGLVFFSDRIKIPGNTSSGVDRISLPVSHPGMNESMSYTLFGPELDTISYGIIGLKPGEKKTLSNPMQDLVKTIAIDKFAGIVGEDFAEAGPGEQVLIGFSETPLIAVDDTRIKVPIRVADVLGRDEKGVTISYGSPRIEVYLVDTEQ
ncbi:MAG: hypothetical protein JXA44_09545 [Methanospirillaceae archaeon]|nr:hypothetical protein [Methanospirillaceae archaeon]